MIFASRESKDAKTKRVMLLARLESDMSSKYKIMVFSMELKDIPFTGVADIDTTNLDFEKHGDEMLMDVAHITMYRYENGKYKKLEVVKLKLSKKGKR